MKALGSIFLLEEVPLLGKPSEKAVKIVRAVSQKTYHEIDDFVPSRIGVIVAECVFSLSPRGFADLSACLGVSCCVFWKWLYSHASFRQLVS